MPRALTTESARVGIAIRCVAHPEWGMWMLARDRNGWTKRNARGDESMLDPGEFGFWEIVDADDVPPHPDDRILPQCIVEMACACAHHAAGGDAVSPCNTSEADAKRRTRGEIEREILSVVRAMGALRMEWPKEHEKIQSRRGKGLADRRAVWYAQRDALQATLESLAVDFASLPEREPDVVLVPLTPAQIGLLIDAVDSHVYERAPEHAHRNSGHIMDPRLDPDFDEDEDVLSDEDQETADFLDEHDAVERILHAHLPKEDK